LDALMDGPLDVDDINLLAGTPTAPPAVLIDLRLESLTKSMVAKIPSARHLRPSATAKTVERPELGFNSVAGRVIKCGQHGIPSPMLSLERRVQKLVSVKIRVPGSARQVGKYPGGALLVGWSDATTAPGPMKPLSEVVA
jgi:hypothetical protein